jgi:hypothetical protein
VSKLPTLIAVDRPEALLEIGLGQRAPREFAVGGT